MSWEWDTITRFKSSISIGRPERAERTLPIFMCVVVVVVVIPFRVLLTVSAINLFAQCVSCVRATYLAILSIGKDGYKFLLPSNIRPLSYRPPFRVHVLCTLLCHMGSEDNEDTVRNNSTAAAVVVVQLVMAWLLAGDLESSSAPFPLWINSPGHSWVALAEIRYHLSKEQSHHSPLQWPSAYNHKSLIRLTQHKNATTNSEICFWAMNEWMNECGH